MSGANSLSKKCNKTIPFKGANHLNTPGVNVSGDLQMAIVQSQLSSSFDRNTLKNSLKSLSLNNSVINPKKKIKIKTEKYLKLEDQMEH